METRLSDVTILLASRGGIWSNCRKHHAERSMRATRRDFLAASTTLGLAAAARAFPVPLWRAPAELPPLRPPSDALPPLPDGAFRRLGSRRFRTSKSIARIQFSP